MSSAPPATGEPLDLVLHIGSGKTGTSSIQRLMAKNRPWLAERGVLYPRSPGNGRHIRFGMLIRSDAELAGQFAWQRQIERFPKFRQNLERRLLAEARRAGTSRVLISDESLYGASSEALERLRALTDRIASRVRVVAYLRRQDDHLSSRYQQVVKTGHVHRLAQRQSQEHAKTYDYYARLSTWRRLVEPGEMIVRPFERQRFENGSLYQDFLTAAGLDDIPLDEMAPIEPVNESLDAESVEFLRILNLHRVHHEGIKPGMVNNRELVARLAPASTGPTLTLPDAMLDEFMARWSESNSAVAREFLGDASGQLFRTPRKTGNTTTEQRLDPARLDHFFALLELPEQLHEPLRRIAEREAGTA